MTDSRPSRRTFLKESGTLLGGAWLAALVPDIEAAALFAAEAHREGRPFAVLSPQEGRALAAVCDRILPGGSGGPGAAEAGAVHFADRALDTFFAFQREGVQATLAALDARARRLTPGARAFADLPPDFQDAVLREIEDGPGFFGLRMLAIMGTLSAPAHGGNQGEVGWRLVGYEHAGAFRPPFGWYDRDAHGPGAEG